MNLIEAFIAVYNDQNWLFGPWEEREFSNTEFKELEDE